MNSGGILAGLKVLDLSRMLSGPYASMMMADHGAEVIKIEDATGDTSRTNGPYRVDDPDHEWAGYFVSLNRSKKSVQLDLKSEEGKNALRRMVKDADVLLENFRPGVMERLGLSYESLAEINPRLVYAAIRGFGDPRTGHSPYAEWPAYDVVAQAMGGLISVTGIDRTRMLKVGPGIGDVFAGMIAAFGILAAVRSAEATGQGQFLDVAMYDAMLSLCERLVYQHDFDGTVPRPEGNAHPLLAPFGLYPSEDGMVAIGVVDDAFWQALCDAMKCSHLGSAPEFATKNARRENMLLVNRMVTDWTSKHKTSELTKLLGGRIPFGPVNDIAAIFADPHVAARQMITQIDHADYGKRGWSVAGNPLKFSKSSPPTPRPPPRLGADQFLTETPPEVSLDHRALRNAFGTFATGVTVVTTIQEDGTPRGFTANSFTSVSLDPPLLLVCLAKTAFSCETFANAPVFAINILAEDQKAISGLFASKAPNKFEQCDWSPATTGVPILRDTLAYFVCDRHKLVDAGDHLILIGRVQSFDVAEKRPLGYFKGNYFSLGVDDALVNAAVAGRGSRIGALLDFEGGVLVQTNADGSLQLPTTEAANPSITGLTDILNRAGFQANIEFIYAAFDDRTSGGHAVYYHGNANGTLASGYQVLQINQIETAKYARPSEGMMLQRYAEDHRNGTFTIYHGNETSGLVREIK